MLISFNSKYMSVFVTPLHCTHLNKEIILHCGKCYFSLSESDKMIDATLMPVVLQLVFTFSLSASV